jgi:hypothetical protein
LIISQPVLRSSWNRPRIRSVAVAARRTLPQLVLLPRMGNYTDTCQSAGSRRLPHPTGGPQGRKQVDSCA